MRVIVSGGTGFIGQALVRALTERGDDVVVLSRGESRCHLGPRPECCRGAGKVEMARWWPFEGATRDGLTRLVDGADAVVNLAGAGLMDEPWTPERRDILRASRLRATETLARAIAAAEQKPRAFVSFSAVGYYGTNCGDRELTEADPAGTDFLATLTRDWESAADEARHAGVRVCHPRTGIVLGREGGALRRMVWPFKMFLGGPLGDGRQYIPWIHLADVVRATEFALTEAAFSGAFNVTAPEPVKMEMFARALGDALDRPSAMRIPSGVLRAALGRGRAEVLLGGQRALPARLSDAGFAFLFPDLASALADLVATQAVA